MNKLRRLNLKLLSSILLLVSCAICIIISVTINLEMIHLAAIIAYVITVSPFIFVLFFDGIFND